MQKLFGSIVLALCLSACATPSKYQWGGYEAGLYGSYKDPNKVEELRLKLEALIANQEKSGQKVPPGIYAELGTLYLQAGSSDKASELYARERSAWPESKTFMDALIQNIERRKQASLEAKK